MSTKWMVERGERNPLACLDGGKGQQKTGGERGQAPTRATVLNFRSLMVMMLTVLLLLPSLLCCLHNMQRHPSLATGRCAPTAGTPPLTSKQPW
jgi:hypothetical protein